MLHRRESHITTLYCGIYKRFFLLSASCIQNFVLSFKKKTPGMLECGITSLVSICLTHFVYINRGLAHSVHYIKSIIYRAFTPNVQQLIRYLIFISKNVIPYYGCGRVSTHRSAIHGSTSAPIFVCICLAGLLTRAELLVLHGGFARSHQIVYYCSIPRSHWITRSRWVDCSRWIAVSYWIQA